MRIEGTTTRTISEDRIFQTEGHSVDFLLRAFATAGGAFKTVVIFRDDEKIAEGVVKDLIYDDNLQCRAATVFPEFITITSEDKIVIKLRQRTAREVIMAVLNYQ